MTNVIRIQGFNLFENVTTKREVLYCIAKIFDPLGLLVSVDLVGKLFLQKLRKINQPWNEPLCQDLSTEWNHIFKMLVEIPSLSIFRIIKCSNMGMNQLLIFSDASVHCYATAVYLRSVEENSIKVNLVFAKTRLVPVTKGRKNVRVNCTKIGIDGSINWSSTANFVAAELKLPIME